MSELISNQSQGKSVREGVSGRDSSTSSCRARSRQTSEATSLEIVLQRIPSGAPQAGLSCPAIQRAASCRTRSASRQCCSRAPGSGTLCRRRVRSKYQPGSWGRGLTHLASEMSPTADTKLTLSAFTSAASEAFKDVDLGDKELVSIFAQGIHASAKKPKTVWTVPKQLLIAYCYLLELHYKGSLTKPVVDSSEEAEPFEQLFSELRASVTGVQGRLSRYGGVRFYRSAAPRKESARTSPVLQDSPVDCL